MLDETWVPDNQEQAENRIMPMDKKRWKDANVGVYYYRTRGTVEEYVQKLVADKAMNNKTILDLRRRIQEELRKEEAKSKA
jgi:SNF2 family DNA or RNA helicase